MKLLKKDNVKEVLCISLIAIGTMAAILGCLTFMQYKQYRWEINKQIAGIIYKMIQVDPGIETEIIKDVQAISEQDIQAGIELLDKYGMEQDEVYFLKLEKQLNTNLKLNVFTIIILGLLLLAIFLVFIFIKDRKLEEITEYMRRIQKKDYTLKIKDNNEGELSNLRNELYKITVMLREQTENLKSDKIFLEESMSDISHQLKTPLTSVSVMIDILKENKNIPEEKKKEFLFEVSRQLDWINWLVISLLKMSKLDAGTADLKQEQVKVEKLVEQALQNLAILIDIKNQKVVVKGDKNTSFIGDDNWSLEAVMNIIKNCLEHTQEGGKVDIQFCENELYTEIKVTDEGTGIAKEDIPHIFERFYKGKNASKDSIGIGLALAQSIVKNQGGDITVKSEEGVGTEFSIKWYKGVI